MTYGTLDLSARALTIMSIVTVLMLIAASVAYALRHAGLGLALQSLTFVPLVVLMATWFTELSSEDWDNMGPAPVIGAVCLGAVVLLLPPSVGDIIDNI